MSWPDRGCRMWRRPRSWPTRCRPCTSGPSAGHCRTTPCSTSRTPTTRSRASNTKKSTRSTASSSSRATWTRRWYVHSIQCKACFHGNRCCSCYGFSSNRATSSTWSSLDEPRASSRRGPCSKRRARTAAALATSSSPQRSWNTTAPRSVPGTLDDYAGIDNKMSTALG